MSLDRQLNHLLVGLYQEIMDVEEKSLITDQFSDISINDMHIIEAIGLSEPKPSSQVSKALGITMGTLTKAVDALTRKGYVRRERSEEDKRVVLLSLYEKGRIAYEHHAKFHEDMVQAVIAQLDPEESAVLEKTLSSLQDYFKSE